jgi:predicted ribosome quality control (RQC) complex YloA/Tae2 family protein
MCRTTLYAAVQEIVEDCKEKAASSKAFSEEITKDIIDPLKALLNEQSDTQKSIDAKWKLNNRLYDEKKTLVGVASNKYTKSTTEFDDAMSNFLVVREGKDFTEEKKNRLNQKIDALLAANKEAEKAYKTSVYAAKETRDEYKNALVNFSM